MLTGRRKHKISVLQHFLYFTHVALHLSPRSPINSNFWKPVNRGSCVVSHWSWAHGVCTPLAKRLEGIFRLKECFDIAILNLIFFHIGVCGRRIHPLGAMSSVHETPGRLCGSENISRVWIHKVAGSKQMIYHIWVNNPFNILQIVRYTPTHHSGPWEKQQVEFTHVNHWYDVAPAFGQRRHTFHLLGFQREVKNLTNKPLSLKPVCCGRAAAIKNFGCLN